MSEQLKFLVAELNSEPFNKGYNLINFDSLNGEQLLQILSDVLCEIESKSSIDIREEEPEQTILRILGSLRILKYKPPMEISHNFREGLLAGNKQVIYPVLEWLLQRRPDLKKRAYLAKYLVKVEVPHELLMDADVADLNDQYEQLIETFKSVHKECEAIKNSGYSTAELRKDIEEMDKEKETVMKKIERMERKVEGMPNSETMLSVAKRLRKERERSKELLEQKKEQKYAIQHADQRLQRMEKQLQDLRQSSAGATPEGLVKKLEEETNVTTYIVSQKLPKEIESKKKAVESLQRVTERPALGQDDVNQLKKKIQEVNKEINELTDKRNVTNDPMEDKLTLFRQQAAIVARKKDGMAESLSDVKSEVAAAEEEVQRKRDEVKSFAGETVVKGDDFKKYVSSLRSKSNTYKDKRAEMSDLRAEYGVLSRTVEILQAKESKLLETLESLERDQGVSGFRDTQDQLEKVATEKADLDAQKGQTLEEMSALVQQLSMKISDRKAKLAPIIKELRPLRIQRQDLQVDYDARKSSYDTLLLQLESSMSRLEQEVKSMQDEIISNEAKFFLTKEQNSINELLLKRAQDELKSYVGQQSQDEDGERKRSVRDQLLKIISEQEKKSKYLKEEQKSVRENLNQSSRQVKLWGDLEKLLTCKKKCIERGFNDSEDAFIHREPGAETLVL